MKHGEIIDFIRNEYNCEGNIPLHAPTFKGNEQNYITESISSTFVSSVGAFVDKFENDIAKYTGSPAAVATVNGTAALHIALKLVGVEAGDLVITQALTFVATCNAIRYCNALPVLIDVDRKTLGLSPERLEEWLSENTRLDADGLCRTRIGNAVVRACVPMHTFGHPVDIDGLNTVCDRWNLQIVEDAAESLGSLYKGRHTGTFGKTGILSFNGNKIITTGGGGMILTSSELGRTAKHLTTTAKQPHPYEFHHDTIGYNYRLPNLNAALGVAQLEALDDFISAKRLLANRYAALFEGSNFNFVQEPEHCRSNYWLNAVICSDRTERDELLQSTNRNGVMTRPVWELMNQLPMYQTCLKGDLTTSEWLQARLVNLPSSPPQN